MLFFDRYEYPLASKIFLGLTLLLMFIVGFVNKYKKFFAYLFVLSGNAVAVAIFIPESDE